MRRRSFYSLVLFALLFFSASIATAEPESSYTNISMVPGAVDFTYQVTKDSQGELTVITDYPGVSFGADRMDFWYADSNHRDVCSLRYDCRTGEVKVGSWDADCFSSEEEVYDAIKNGEYSIIELIQIGTLSKNGSKGWVLNYDARNKRYDFYSYGNSVKAFDGTFQGETRYWIFYDSNGDMSGSCVRICSDSYSLELEFDKFSRITDESHIAGLGDIYYYDPSTGLFEGHDITEFGFSEDVLSTEAPVTAIPSPLQVGDFVVTKIRTNSANDHDVWTRLSYTGGMDSVIVHYQVFARNEDGWFITQELDSYHSNMRFWLREDGDHYFKAQITDGVSTYDLQTTVFTVSGEAVPGLLILPRNLTVIEAEAFLNVSASRFDIPNEVESIGQNAFPSDATLIVGNGTYAQEWALQNGYTPVIRQH